MAWDEYFPDFKVPKAIQKLVDLGMVVDSTRPQDASPNFDSVLRDGGVLTIWVDHPMAGKRIGQERRYGLRIADPMHQGTTLLETDNLEELLDRWSQEMRKGAGPRMAGFGGWWMPMYEYTGY